MEKFYPKMNSNGTIGLMNGTTCVRSWEYGCFTHLVLNGVGYTFPSADGTVGQVLATDGSGTFSWTSATTTAFDDIGDPDGAGTVAFTTFAQTLTSTKTDGDMVNIQGLGDFGDVTVLRVEQKTGNPTDGTVLEVVAADANVDPLVVSASTTANALVVGQNTGVVTVAGVANGTNTLVLTAGDAQLTDGNVKLVTGYISFGADPADAGTLRFSNAGTLKWEASGAGVDVEGLSVDASEVVQIGASGASGVTITPNVTCTGNIAAVDGTFSGNVLVTGTFLQDALTPATAATTITLDGTGVGGVTVGGTSTGGITLGGGATLVTLPSTVDLVLAGGDLTVTDTANADMVTFTNNHLVLSAAGTRTSDSVIEITDGSTTASTISITANTQTSGNGLEYGNTGAGLTGSAIYLAITDGAGFTGNYINCYDGAASDFKIARYGATTIAGVAASDVLTVTAGNVQVDNGKIEIDTTQNIGNYIKRNDATGGSPVLEIEQTHATGGIALLVDTKNTTAAEYAIDITSSGATQLHFTANGAAGDGILYDATDAWTGQAFKIDAGPWVGTLTEGAALDFRTDSAATAEAGQAIYIKFQGSATDAAGINGKGLYIEDEAALTAGSHLVALDTKSNNALHINNSGAAADGILFDVANSYTGQGIVADLGPWLGTTNEGFIQISSDNAATIPAGQFIRLRQLGTGQHAAAIGGTCLYMEDDATAPAAGTSYVMNIDATNIEAIHVDTGKVLVDETVTATGAAADSLLLTDTVNLTAAEVKALNASPKSLIATPGADKFIEVMSLVLILDYGSEVFTETADNLVLQYGTSGDDITAAIEMTGFIDQAADTIMAVYPIHPWTANAAADIVNNAVVLYNTNDEIAGNASNDGQLTCKITYRIHTAGLA